MKNNIKRRIKALKMRTKQHDSRALFRYEIPQQQRRKKFENETETLLSVAAVRRCQEF